MLPQRRVEDIAGPTATVPPRAFAAGDTELAGDTAVIDDQISAITIAVPVVDNRRRRCQATVHGRSRCNIVDAADAIAKFIQEKLGAADNRHARRTHWSTAGNAAGVPGGSYKRNVFVALILKHRLDGHLIGRSGEESPAHRDRAAVESRFAQTVHAFGNRSLQIAGEIVGRFHQHNLGLRRNRMGPLNVEHRLAVPALFAGLGAAGARPYLMEMCIEIFLEVLHTRKRLLLAGKLD